MLRKLAIAAACLALVGCRQDMHDAPSYDPLQGTEFFSNGAASRTLVATALRARLRIVPPPGLLLVSDEVAPPISLAISSYGLY